MATDVQHLATVSITAEPNGYAVWHTGRLHKFFHHDRFVNAIKAAQVEARALVKKYKPEYSGEL